MKKVILSFLLISSTIIPQTTGTAYNPMTAPGAVSINRYSHTLYWINPSNVLYNECYFSSDSLLVANLDTTVRIQNGFSTTVNDSVIISSLQNDTKYFWRIVEYDSLGIPSASDEWYFYALPGRNLPLEGYQFDYGTDGWQATGPDGITNWYWEYYTGVPGMDYGNIVFSWTPEFIGESFFVSPVLIAPAGFEISLQFNYYEDYYSDTVVVGCVLLPVNNNLMDTVWEIHATGSMGPEMINKKIYSLGHFRIGFYYSGNSFNINNFYFDNLVFNYPLSYPFPPTLLKANASLTEKKVILNWNDGNGGGNEIYGYIIQRKPGLPEDEIPYIAIDTVGQLIRSFIDSTVELKNNYTYRISTLVFLYTSYYSNEATAYMPLSIPVELINFTAVQNSNGVQLNWTTATETNNKGFEIERAPLNLPKGETLGWAKIDFVDGNGTTTEQHNYTFIDNDVSSGKYSYRLKQIDFDGTFKYSKTAEVELNIINEFSLSQNYPNPFNPVTNIKYSLPQNEFVTLKVFNTLGEEVATLVKKQLPAGNYTVKFGAGNLPSGVYIYKLTAGVYSNTKKLLLLK
jgi:Secretion system C-terminal sorting domain